MREVSRIDNALVTTCLTEVNSLHFKSRVTVNVIDEFAAVLGVGLLSLSR